MRIDEILRIMNEKAPLSLSAAACSVLGAYDNSGLLIEGREKETEGVVFALDLNRAVVDLAEKSGYKLIITHHPAIYRPIKTISCGVYTRCIESGITVYSTHLSLDSAKAGIDDGLALLCGARNVDDLKILENTVDGRGFGRSFKVEKTTFSERVRSIVSAIGTKKYMAFGDPETEITAVASFCGAGLDENLIAVAIDCEMLVSADIPHHVLLNALEKGKCVLQLTHYASEAIAMLEFARKTCDENNIKYRFYLDERFM